MKTITVHYDFKLCLKCPHVHIHDKELYNEPWVNINCGITEKKTEIVLDSGRDPFQFVVIGLSTPDKTKMRAFLNFIPPTECPFKLEHLLKTKLYKDDGVERRWWSDYKPIGSKA